MAPNRRDKNSIFAMTALFAIIVACIVTAGCMGGTSTPGVTGGSWSLDSYQDENGTLVPVLPGTTITARFDDDGKVTGSAGCNLYSGGYHQDKTALSVSTLAQTLKFCMEPEGIMEQEARFMELIGSAAGWKINDGRLIITDATGATTLVFEVGEPVPIAGTSWTLLSLAGENGTLMPVIAGTTVTAIFNADGNLGGNAGCNHYAADYTVDSANLSIRPTTQTEMYCGEPEGIMAQEDRYLVLIEDVTTYRIEGNRLFLADSEGNDLLVFEKTVPVPDLPLIGTDWVLDGYRTDGDAISSVIAGTKVTVMFADDGKIGGNAGCNLYGGGYTLNGTNLSVSSVFSTLMYCGEPEGTMEQEGKYLGLLENVSSYRVDGNRLTLTDAAGMDLLFFVEAEKVPPAPLTGTEWTLESYRLDEAVSSVIAGTTITATFSPDGNITGNAGCNRYFAAYEAAESTMTIGPAGSTKMYCGEPEGTMEQEARYLGLLESVTGYRIDADQLDLFNEEGRTLLTYRAEGADRP